MASARTNLEKLRDKLPAGAARDQVEKILADPYEAAQVALWAAMQLGAAENWDGGADYLDAVADELGHKLPHPGDDDNKPLYRELARSVGMYYRGMDDEEDEEEDDEHDLG